MKLRKDLLVVSCEMFNRYIDRQAGIFLTGIFDRQAERCLTSIFDRQAGIFLTGIFDRQAERCLTGIFD